MDLNHYVENSVTFKITNQEDDDYNAVGTFFSILEKCRKEADKKGFRNLFNKEEKLFIKEFTDELNIIADENTSTDQ